MKDEIILLFYPLKSLLWYYVLVNNNFHGIHFNVFQMPSKTSIKTLSLSLPTFIPFELASLFFDLSTWSWVWLL